MKTFYMESLGCAKNQVDSEVIISGLAQEGYEQKDNPDDADLIVVNTCAFIESAKRESLDVIFRFRQLYPDKKISVRGCLAIRYKNELQNILPEADEFVDALPDTRISGERTLLSLPGSAYIKISEGCNRRCSFCAIPAIRGNLVSRRQDDILAECKALLARGVKELVIIAQDTGSYGADWGVAALPALLENIAKLQDGGFWVRLLYIHPDTLLGGSFFDELLGVMQKHRQILPYFDLPFQHAAPDILAAMGRAGSAEAYLAVIEKARRVLPSAVIRSTFLTGFPGETDADFETLLDFQQKAQIDWLGVFAYSREEGTAAASLKKRVPKKTAAERKARLEEAQVPITEARLGRLVGQRKIALLEEETGGAYLARLDIHAPLVDGAAVIRGGAELSLGSFVEVAVERVSGVDVVCSAG